MPAGPLPEAPLAAAAAFHALAPEIIRGAGHAAEADDDLLIVFAPADPRHRGWRAAVIADLARAAAPRRRVNALVSAEPRATAAAAAWLAGAPGVTGQVLMLDGHGAGDVVIPQE